MDSDRAKVFLRVADLDPTLINRFGNNFCFIPMISDCIVKLIRVDDYYVRDAAAAFFTEFFSV